MSETPGGPNVELLAAVARAAGTAKVGAYLVGGAVRDSLLGRPPVDVDAALEGPVAGAAATVSELSGEPGWTCRARHERFGTATLRAPEGERVDLAATREETYHHPGALPVVRTGVPISRDLARRDFTIHAMAFRLGETGVEGPLLDPFEGERDLGLRRIRLLHPDSLADDPTRVFRAARYAARLGFTLDGGFVDAMKRAVESGAFARISGDRLRRAFQEALSEENRDVVLQVLRHLAVPGAIVDGWLVPAGDAWALGRDDGKHGAWASLLAGTPPGLRERIASRLSFSRALRKETGCPR